MNKIWDWKKEYEALTPSEGFRERIEQTMRAERRRKNWKRALSTVAVVAVVSTAAVNVSPSLAYATAGVPVLGSLVQIVTLGRSEVKDNGFTATVVTPQIEGLLDQELEDQLNQEFQDNANAVIAAFEQDKKKLEEEFGDETVHMDVEQNYQVKTDNEDYLAIDLYTYTAVGSSSTVHSFYTFDKKNGTLVTLESLFKDGADYVTPISDYLKDEMRRMNAEEGGMFWVKGDENVIGDEGFDTIAKDQNFYINNDGALVICFDKYEVAAGAQGSPEFVIPQDVIADIWK